MNPYLKTVAALLGALGTWGITASADGHYSHPELWGSLLALATAFGVYVTPYHRPADTRAVDEGQVDPGRPGRSSRLDMSEQGYLNLLAAVILGALALIGLLYLLR